MKSLFFLILASVVSLQLSASVDSVKSIPISFYYPPEEQYYALDEDSENQALRDKISNKEYSMKVMKVTANAIPTMYLIIK